SIWNGRLITKLLNAPIYKFDVVWRIFIQNWYKSKFLLLHLNTLQKFHNTVPEHCSGAKATLTLTDKVLVLIM
ncbi:hypothetical protein, partial [Nostoc sp.]|uniref:hypothetical protein n=1 Tax=Nostoc sp. TaxID=1180 RepID=UPI002FF561B4